MPDTPVASPVFEWHKTNPTRRPRPDNEVAVPEKPKSTLFAGLFRRRLTERYLEDFKKPLARLDNILATEPHLAVVAAYYQIAVEAMVRIKRTDLAKEFEQERDKAILAARQVKPMKVFPKDSRPRGFHGTRAPDLANLKKAGKL